MDTNCEYILSMKNINKTFPGVKSLENVELNLKYGEVLSLCGENGAGKSTLMKILTGIHQPDSDESEICYEGRKVFFKQPIEAKLAGIIMVFQELSLIRDLSVAENIYLGCLPILKGRVDWKKLFSDTKKVLEELDCHINPRTRIGTLPIAQQQMVEIARGIALGAKILVLDEPTSSLTDKEKVVLFKNINKLKSRGTGIIYISHKMDEVMEISDRIIILRDGKNTGDFDIQNVTIDDIVQSMIGRSLNNYYEKSQAQPGEEILRVEGLSLKGTFEDISFNVRRGEIVGLYGLVGAGRSEIMESIFGIRKPNKGTIFYRGKKIKIRNSVQAAKLKIGFVPENRKEQGLILEATCRENISLAKLPYIQKAGFVKQLETHKIYQEYKAKLKINSASSEQKVVNLSGGNQQKIILGKWMATAPDLFILDEPTRGIDIGSKADIHGILSDLAESGMAVIVISSEMPEIIGVSNRLIIIKEGKIMAELTADDINEENIIKHIMINNSLSAAGVN